MKTHLLALTASFAALSALVSPVQAGDRGDKFAAAIGGFIGGVIVGSHLDHDRGYRPGPPPAYYPPPPPVCHEPVVVSPSGYWSDVRERVWMPAHWIVTCDFYGRRVRTHRPGYYDYQTRRVWVEYRGGPGRGYGHSYGPGVVSPGPRRW